ncbi:MAG TPA: Gfo/Idh/MocA family oxidoreductase [Planctomycetes bacterium]|nr:Gfo/Idh/MocA family oxidoreductase [Planctomycetota bacterium]
MKHNYNMNRRKFLETTSVMAAGAIGFPYIVTASALGNGGAVAPSNRTVVGAIGVGEQGNGVLGNFLNQSDAQVVAVCDVDKARREGTCRRIEQHYQKKGCAVYNDFRDLLVRDDIDAVLIATPDHWHVLCATAAAKAGKDMYMEKPLGLNVAEGQALQAVVNRYGTIFQFGTQQRSDIQFRLACELVRNGRIGKLHTINVWAPPSVAGGSTKKAAVPDGLDYDMWLGPAPFREYTYNRCASDWDNKFWWFNSDYCIGWISGWGIHPVDIALWGAGGLLSGPIGVEGTGIFPTEGLCDTATYWNVKLDYASAVTMNFMSNPPPAKWLSRYNTEVDHGTAFEGTEGWVYVNRNEMTVSDESIRLSGSSDDIKLYQSTNHVRNFLDCAKSRTKTICPVDQAHQADVVCHISDIAIRYKRRLKWDMEKEIFIGDDSANRMLSRSMRSPWRL